ncbi:preprotein translocase subunit SecA [Poriferisphaera corsica]|uniref:Protein translocase subunit SecA n=1 Tax=Poriferisphaera corsica TaxID=2528020 RepID=A0A517YT06_9BACT|nr:DEAD/DEAH box helicase [Poriferisphaera corsica]QDU33292.1 preprotein translocase subunit SecA [Poriferisphaera corsica]
MAEVIKQHERFTIADDEIKSALDPANMPRIHAQIAWEACKRWQPLKGDREAKKLLKGFDAFWDTGIARFVNLYPRTHVLMKRAAKIIEISETFKDLSEADFKEKIQEYREIYRRSKDDDQSQMIALAIVREASRRSTGMAHYQNQIACALAITRHSLAEMATGEGKTLTATMPAVLEGWRGRGVHVMTSNDYLAHRDAEEMRPVYEYCGLKVSAVTNEMAPNDRRNAYYDDVTYATHQNVAADYLRDKLQLGSIRSLTHSILDRVRSGKKGVSNKLVMRGLAAAVIDEADSILVDESVTPLIISGDSDSTEEEAAYHEARELAQQLIENVDYKVNVKFKEVELTRQGNHHLEELTEEMKGIWQSGRMREEWVNQALTAAHLFNEGEQYIIDDKKIVIVDESTGRLMPDRTWRAGLHQAVEAKEDVPVTGAKETLARISFQRFFRLYPRIGGMTGTGWEARNEMWQMYRLPTVRIPTNKPCVREQLPEKVFSNDEQRWQGVIEEVKRVHQSKRPILIGTRSIETSEKMSDLLKKAGIEHQVLNAVNHAEEADIVSAAGQEGRVTVATNMAGRGTDIKLKQEVKDFGGLHVVSCERNETGRVDRQLFGRAGRQGDPGSAISFAAMDDDLVIRYGPSKIARYLGKFMNGSRAFDKAQQNAEKQAYRQRKSVLKQDDWLRKNLGFAGSEH